MAINSIEIDLDPLVVLCQEGIKQRLFPGAAFAVGNSKNIHFESVGNTTYEPASCQPVTEHTLYDLASLTKPIIPATIAVSLVCMGMLDLDEPIEERPELSVRNLLLHNSGLPPYRNFHFESPIPQSILNEILTMPLEAEPGERVAYSCLGFVLLQIVIERVLVDSLDGFLEDVKHKIPYCFESSAYMPWNLKLDENLSIAPTTVVEPWRRAMIPEGKLSGDFLCGAVHDPLAFLLGGVSGNAGLFGSASEVGKFAQRMLQWSTGDISNPHTELFQKSIQPQAGSRALGWDMWSPGCSAGTKFSKSSFGHTGYTGTSIWIDPENDSFAVLLTNRVHPDDSASLVELRPKFHDLAFELFKPTSPI